MAGEWRQEHTRTRSNRAQNLPLAQGGFLYVDPMDSNSSRRCTHVESLSPASQTKDLDKHQSPARIGGLGFAPISVQVVNILSVDQETVPSASENRTRKHEVIIKIGTQRISEHSVYRERGISCGAVLYSLDVELVRLITSGVRSSCALWIAAIDLHGRYT